MPSTATITSFYNFTALTVIRSAQVNTNFDTFRGHIIPVDPSTATSATTMTYDLGSIDHMWRGQFNQYGIMYGNTAGSVPTVPTSTAYALYFKNDGNLYKKDSSGTETAFSAAGNLSIATTTGGFSITSSNDIILSNESSNSTYDLPTAVGNSGKIIRVKKISDTTTTATIDGSGSQTIDGSLTNVLNYKNDEVEIISDNSNWQILNSRKSPTIQRFTSGSGTYTTPNGVKYIKVRMVGGGGGGGGSGSGGGTGGTGGNTTFGTSLLTANGGAGGVFGGSSNAGGAGGGYSISSPAIGSGFNGSYGFGYYPYNQASTFSGGGYGASSHFGGGGASSGATNTGAGGAGGGSSGSSIVIGTGGGAGGYIDAIIPNPNTTYSYSVGAAGTAGSAGTSGSAGSAGAAGYIEVTEYYQ